MVRGTPNLQSPVMPPEKLLTAAVAPPSDGSSWVEFLGLIYRTVHREKRGHALKQAEEKPWGKPFGSVETLWFGCLGESKVMFGLGCFWMGEWVFKDVEVVGWSRSTPLSLKIQICGGGGREVLGGFHAPLSVFPEAGAALGAQAVPEKNGDEAIREIWT
nr:hypothetical protein Iba_chr05fCG6500 [Ipomoea batatas]GME17537.1 hypothetical protein Iba_scaffold18920CG0490 [Ipomoea batatas]